MMNKQSKFPYQFFIVTFIWSWSIWLPLVLAGAGILPMGKELRSVLSIPMIGLGAFGPAAGAFYCLRTLQGKGAIRDYLRGLLDLHFGWQAWLLPILVLGGSTGLAWVLPELWGAPRLNMFLPSIWVFPPYVLYHDIVRRRTGRIGLARLYFGPTGRKTGAVVGESCPGGGLGLLAYPAIFYSGCKPKFYAFCRICVADGRLFLVLRLGSAIFRKTHPGRGGRPRLVQRVCSPVPYVGYGQGGRAAAFLDLGEPDICNWLGNHGLSLEKKLTCPPDLAPFRMPLLPKLVSLGLISGKQRARLEGLEPPTRCLEGSWATVLTDGI